MVEIQDVYASQQEALARLVLERIDRVDAPVPACPGWTVRAVVAHVVGLARDAVGGGLPVMDLLEQWRDDSVAGTRDAMTAAQVGLGADRSVEDLVAEWRELTVTMTPMLRGTVPFPEPAPFGLSAIFVTDLTIHDQDVRGALGATRATDGPGPSLALASYGFGVDYRIRQLGLPALAVHYDGKERVLGGGEPGAAVSSDRFELVRAFGGRRSRAQILAYEWSGDPGPYLPLIPAYGEREEPLYE